MSILPPMAGSRTRTVKHVQSGQVLIEETRWCDSFLSRMRGFTFKRKINKGEGLVLVDKQDSRINAAITMLFVFFDLGVIWVNESGKIVDKKLARSWRLSYSPKEPAKFVVESHPDILDKIQIGDHLTFIEPETEPDS